MSLDLSLLIVVMATNVFLGALVFLKDPRGKINRSFAFTALGISLWGLFIYLTRFPNHSLLWARSVFAVAFLQGGSLLYFALVFPADAKYFRWLRRWIIYPASAVFALVSLISPFIVATVTPQNSVATVIPGTFYFIFFIWMLLCVLGMLGILLQKYLKAVGVEKSQIKFVFYGMMAVALVVLPFNMILPLFLGNNSLAQYGPYSVLILIGFIAYSITKHYLFDIKVIITEMIVVLISFGLLTDALVSTDLAVGVFKGVLFILVTYGGYQLVKSVRLEIGQRQKIQVLADELKKANVHLKDLDAEKDNFLSMASHELNSPLAAIKGYLSMMLDEGIGGKLTKKQHEFLDMVYTSSKRLAHLVNDLLNVSRIEQGRIHLVYDETNINDIINQASKELSPNIKEAKHKLILNLDEKLPNSWWDQDRINEIVTNLLSNAVKYTEPGGRIEIASQTAHDKILVSISDNGIGIPRDSIGRIFGKFEQGNMNRDQRKGTGLGLYIVKNLVELHGGKIWVDSVEGKGTTFFFTLPIHKTKPLDIHSDEGGVLRLK